MACETPSIKISLTTSLKSDGPHGNEIRPCASRLQPVHLVDSDKTLNDSPSTISPKPMDRSHPISGKEATDTASGGTTPDRSRTPDPREEGSARQREAPKEALGAFKTCLDLTSTILSALPFQAPKAAVDTIEQMVTAFLASNPQTLPSHEFNADASK